MFKKLFSLIAFSALFSLSLSAETLCSYTFPDEILSSSTATVSGEGCTVSYAKVGGSESNCKALEGKYYHKLTNAASAWIKITLTSGVFKAGDVFSATLYNGSTNNDGFRFKTAETGNSATVTYSKTAEVTLEYTLTEDDINEDGSLTLYRYGSACHVRHIEVSGTKGPAPTVVQWNFSGWEYAAGTSETVFTEPTEITGLTIMASENMSMKINNNSKTVDGVKYTKRLQLGGRGGSNGRQVKFNVDGPCTIYVIHCSADSQKEPTLDIATAFSQTNEYDLAQFKSGADPVESKYEYEGAATQICLYSDYAENKGGINLYSIKVVYPAPTAITTHTATVVPANNVVYNLAGQRVNANAKGLVIINGKKYMK